MATSTNIKRSSGKILKSKIVTVGATDISFDQGVPNSIMIDVAGTVTISKVDDDTTEAFAALAIGIWHPMAPFNKVTAGSATGIHVGIAL